MALSDEDDEGDDDVDGSPAGVLSVGGHNPGERYVSHSIRVSASSPSWMAACGGNRLFLHWHLELHEQKLEPGARFSFGSSPSRRCRDAPQPIFSEYAGHDSPQ